MGTINYKKIPPPPIMKSPPPPPPTARTKFVTRVLYPGILLSALGLVVYVYFNKDDDMYEYWKAMQSGQIMPFDDDDEDEDDDDDEE